MLWKHDCIESRPGGHFFCPACELTLSARRVFDRHYISFLNFPLFSLEEVHTGYECTKCRIKFSLRDLKRYEANKEGRGQAPIVFAGSIVRCVLLMLGHERHLNDELVELLLRNYVDHADDNEFNVDDLFKIRSQLVVGESPLAKVMGLQPILTGEQRQRLAEVLQRAAQCYDDHKLTQLSQELSEVLQ